MIKFLKSVKHALNGILISFSGQRNIKIQLCIGTIVLLACLVFPVSKLEFLLVICIIFFVIIMEMINTTIEKTVDAISTKKAKHLGEIKDIAAGFVLLSAVLSVVVGVLIFGPHIFYLIKN